MDMFKWSTPCECVHVKVVYHSVTMDMLKWSTPCDWGHVKVVYTL